MNISEQIINDADRLIQISQPDQIDLIFDQLALARTIRTHLKYNGYYAFTYHLTKKIAQKILVVNIQEFSEMLSRKKLSIKYKELL